MNEVVVLSFIIVSLISAQRSFIRTQCERARVEESIMHTTTFEEN